MSARVSVSAPAKVNLFLGVGEVRPDGYHDVVTVLHSLALADDVTLEIAEELEVLSDADLGVAAECNLAVMGVSALATELGREPLVRIELRKAVPAGAGLGGGSSDAAAAILGAAYLWGLDPRDPSLVRAARSVGADVPFFLEGGAALYRGRGDELEARLPAVDLAVALVKPPVPVSTAAAYAAFDADPVPAGEPLAVLEALELGDMGALVGALDNNLATAAASLVPEVDEAVAWCSAEPGVFGAMVSGSGSAVFAVCDSDASARTVAHRAAERGWWSAATRTSACGARIVEGGS